MPTQGTAVATPTQGPDQASRPVDESTEAPGSGSLKPVLDVIPPAAYRNPTWKGLAYFGRDLVVYAVLVWALIVVSQPLAVVGLEVVMALAVSALFIVGHDAAHGALFRSKRLNSFVGHVAMLPGWHVYEGWILGHNRIHHAYTVRQGYDFVWHPYTVEEYRAMSRWQRAASRCSPPSPSRGTAAGTPRGLGRMGGQGPPRGER